MADPSSLFSEAAGLCSLGLDGPGTVRAGGCVLCMWSSAGWECSLLSAGAAASAPRHTSSCLAPWQPLWPERIITGTGWHVKETMRERAASGTVQAADACRPRVQSSCQGCAVGVLTAPAPAVLAVGTIGAAQVHGGGMCRFGKSAGLPKA